MQHMYCYLYYQVNLLCTDWGLKIKTVPMLADFAVDIAAPDFSDCNPSICARTDRHMQFGIVSKYESLGLRHQAIACCTQMSDMGR